MPVTICGPGGTAGPQPGVGNTLIVPVGLITAGLALISPWLIPFAALLDGFTYDLLANCSNDPPASVSFTAADAAGLIGGPLNPNYGAALAKLQQVLMRHLWFQYCQCTTGNLTTSEGPGPLPPAGVTVPTPAGAGLCFQGEWQGIPNITSSSAPLSQYSNCSSLLPPSAGPGRFISDSGGSYTALAIPNNITSFDFRVQTLQCTLCPNITCGSVDIWFYTATGSIIGNTRLLSGNCIGLYCDNRGNTIPSGAVYWYAAGNTVTGNCGSPNGQLTATTQFYCAGGGPTTISNGCCTDPATLNLLNQIWQEVQAIYQSLPTPLGSYAESTVHSNLSGQGTFGVQATALGVRFDIDVRPQQIGQRAGNPTEYLDVGWITPITTEGPIGSVRLIHSPQLLTLPPLTRNVGYYLTPGVVAHATELLRGP